MSKNRKDKKRDHPTHPHLEQFVYDQPHMPWDKIKELPDGPEKEEHKRRYGEWLLRKGAKWLKPHKEDPPEPFNPEKYFGNKK